MSEIKLDSCPFCGGEVLYLEPLQKGVCSDCKMQFKLDRYITSEEFSKKFNKRYKRHGKWSILKDNGGEYAICSECGYCIDFCIPGVAFNYCSLCGVRMEGFDHEIL